MAQNKTWFICKKWVLLGFIHVSLSAFAQSPVLVSPTEGDGIDFDRFAKVDFNGDGAFDQLVCTGGQITLKDSVTKKVIYSWVRTQLKNSLGYEIRLGKCDVVQIVPGHWSIVQATYFRDPSDGSKHQSDQIVILNTGKGFFPRKVLMPNGSHYQAVGRSVACHKYPTGLVNKGYRAGGLCFYSAYNNGYTTHTALVKFELQNSSGLRTKDLSFTLGNTWTGGMAGTSPSMIVGGRIVSTFRKFRYCDGDTRYDGLHMMDAAFLDIGNNGLPDLVTVGQHASVRISRMFMDVSRTTSEGLYFQTDFLTEAQQNIPTEFLRVTAFNHVDVGISQRCVHISGEAEPTAQCGRVTDHLMCYRKGVWSQVNYPFNFSSEMSNAVIRRSHRDGKILIKTVNAFDNNKTYLFEMAE